MKTCYIIGAAELAIGRLRPSEGDFVIAADAGLLHLAKLHIKPDLMLGDFDSLGRIPSFPNVEVCPVEKDDTDSMIALRHAVTLGCRRILLFGALGGRRLDHTLANIQALAWARAQGAECFIIGEGCALTAIADGDALRFDGRYRGDFSAFCHGPDAAGVSERGLYYRLDRAVLTAAFPLGVSNSFTGEAAEISVESGTLIVYWQDDPALPLPERGKI